MMELRAHGLRQAAIAKRIGMSEKAVRNWLKRGAAPTWKRQSRRRSVFDPSAEYVLQRGPAGIHEGKQLYEEIRAQGFAATVRIVQRGCSKRLPMSHQPFLCLRQQPQNASRPTRRAFLFIREPKKLTEEEGAELALICQRSATAQKSYQLTQQFMTMLRLRRGQECESWLQAVEISHIAELSDFAHSLLKDKDAVVAGLTLPYSNGPVEAQVHKRETWSSAPCLAAPNFRSYANACSMLPDLHRDLC
jgi:transposase